MYLVPKRIEFIVTNLCNSKCRHCYAQKQAPGGHLHVDESLALGVVRDVCARYDVESVMTFGGEPMLYPGVVCSIHREASRNGVPSRQLITNGNWAARGESTRELAFRLAASGVNDVTFSVDSFHQEHIPLEVVRETIEMCQEAGIEDVSLNPCWLISEEDDNVYNRGTRLILEELEGLSLRVSRGNVVEPEGEAIVNLREFMPPKAKIPQGSCGDVPYADPLDRVTSISMEPDGRIAVCNDLYIGDASEKDILSIIESYDPFGRPETKALVEDGVAGLMDWALSKGVKPDPEGYYSICHMCVDLRRRVGELHQPS